ncbi:MAG: thymidylate synthase [Candidatus Paceibacterota bacterium]
MQQYLELLDCVLTHGKKKSDPQGVGNLAICGYQARFLVEDGFPLVTTRNLKGSFKAMVYELLWFLRGETTTKFLNDHGVHFWDQWSTPEICSLLGLEPGDLGPIYGKQWRAFSCGDGVEVDQVKTMLNLLKTNPDSRRIIVTAWNPKEIDEVFVAPCHCFYQFFHAEGELSLHVFQRSGDVPVGVPFDIAEYMLYLLMVAQVVGLKPCELVYTFSDAHIYLDQVDGVKEQLKRSPRALPTVKINPDVEDIFSFRYEDFELCDYNPHPKIKYPVAM